MRGKQLLVAAALRTDEAVRARAPIASIVEVAERLRLRGLDEHEVTELCQSLFGDVEHIPRLARWMHKAAGGSPLYTIELARHLVERGVLHYEKGLWTVPGKLDHEDLPRGLAEAMDARVRGLSPGARALGEALSIHGGELTLELALLVADNHQEDMVFAALDHLAYQEVLVYNGATWRFRHDGLREALLRGLDDERRKTLHLRVGEALASAPGRTSSPEAGPLGSVTRGRSSPEAGPLGSVTRGREAEIGWHLLRGGDRERGARFLDAAGRALYDAQSFSDCIAPLEAALEVLEERPSSQRTRLELLTMLVMSGTLTDRRVALRHADPCLAGLRHWAGIDVMFKVRRVVGGHLAIVVGLAWALVRWLFTPRRGPNPYLAFSQYVVMVTYAASVYAMTFDMANVSRMLRAIEPVAVFKRRVPYAVYLVAHNLDDYPRGHVGAVCRQSRQIVEILARDRLTPIRDIDRRALGGAAHYMLAVAAVSDVEPTWTQQLAELASVRMRFYDIGAENLRAIFHRMRGEEEAAQEIERHVEQMFVQLGSVWQMEAITPVAASLAYAFARDTLGLRRMIDQLSRRVDDGFYFQAACDLARGEYLRAHGDLDESYDAIVASLAVTDHALLRVAALPALAETELARGNLERACEIAQDGISLGADLERGGNINGKLRSVRVLALAEAARGDPASAARRLDAAIEEARPRTSPLLTGSMHEARARIALVAEDWPLFRMHAAEADRLFRSTRNPVLIAHAERLSQLGARPATPPPTAERDPVTVSLRAPDPVTQAFANPPSSDVISWVSGKLAGCRGRNERAQRLLDIVIDETRASAGFLFMRDREGVELVAPSWGEEPTSDLVARVEAILAAPATPAPTSDDWILIPLASDRPSGCVAVRRGALPYREPERELIEEIARRLDADHAASPA